MKRCSAYICAFALTLCMLCMLCSVCALGETDKTDAGSQLHNYILVIDNSKSTINDTYLGPRTDPQGLRFSAAEALYHSIDADNSRIGVIVFCGRESTGVYGPVDRSSPEADRKVGTFLSERANSKRDDFTDITHALRLANQMLDSFKDGDTSVILLTDGVNDLTNSRTPMEDQANIQANKETVEVARQLKARGADLFVVALTSDGQSENRSGFMEFINRLAEAGGGVYNKDKNLCSNVLEARDGSLIGALQAILGLESGDLTDIISTKTPVSETFSVPYQSITDVNLTISFMPDDRKHLDTMELIAPDGRSYLLWKKGTGSSQDSIEVISGDSFVVMKIIEPQIGRWKVVVTGDAGVDIDAIIRFNHNVRLMMRLEGNLRMGEDLRVDAWFQKYADGAFEDITDTALYDQSIASLSLKRPGEESYTTLTMDQTGNGYSKDVHLDAQGNWFAQVTVQNMFLEKSVENYSFTVREPATPTPAPSPAPVGKVDLEVSPTVDSDLAAVYVDRDCEYVTFQWLTEMPYAYTDGQLLQEGVETPVAQGLCPGDSIARARLQQDVSYTLRVQVVPLYGTEADASTHELTFRLYPQPAALSNLRLTAEDAEGNRLKNDTLWLKWSVDGEVDHFELLLTEPNGQQVTRTLAENVCEFEKVLSADGEHKAYLSAVPRYSLNGEGVISTELSVYPRIPGFLEKYMVLLIAAAAIIAALAVGIPLLIRVVTPKMSGELTLECFDSDISFNKTFKFGGKGNTMYRNKPLTAHPEAAKYKGEELLYGILGSLTLTMAQTDNDGYVLGDMDHKQHLPNHEAISITYRDDKGHMKTWYVAGGDQEPEQLIVYDKNQNMHFIKARCGGADWGGVSSWGSNVGGTAGSGSWGNGSGKAGW